ncbi:MAG: HAD-IB family hydrolase [Deltaproteobacteria bacterium]|nr:HAD-IB family hydrolase [Deltaproteobacteria bacterium]
MTNGRIAAFFDFDNTLLAGDSAKIGFKYLWGRGDVGAWFIARIMARNFFYKRNLYSPERISRFALTFYAGRDITEYKAGAREYYETMLKPHIAPKVRERLDRHKGEGHVTALVTASVRYMLEPVVADLGMDHLLCTDLEMGPDGRPTGRPVEPICVCAGKVAHAKRLAEEQGIDLKKSYAYSDHHSDLPLLELVGHPVCVEPNRPLRKIATARGWEVLSFI